MTKAEKIALLTKWSETITKADATTERMLEPLMISPESPLYQMIWMLQSEYTAAVSALVGDESEWLDWFAAENGMGKCGYEADPGNGFKERKIESIEDLVQLIEESE